MYRAKTILILIGLSLAAVLFAQPFAIDENWAFYEAPAATWEEVDVADLARLDPAKREVLSLAGGLFSRETRDGEVSLLVKEFDAPAAGVIWLRCGANCYYLQIGLNGKMIFDGRTTFSHSADGKIGSHVIPLAIQKGRNTLALKFFGTKEGFSDGKRHYCVGIAAADEAEYRKTLPTRENFSTVGCSAMDTSRRHVEEVIIRNGVDQMTATDFTKFDTKPDFSAAELDKLYQRCPVLEFYDRALDKILCEVPQTKVDHGIVVWHLYNMGYVVKTPECCFGIDIHHRRAAELAPLLDFILVTHNHNDHYNLALLREMAKVKKLVISNFYPAKGYQRPPAHFSFADVSIDSEETDHNATLKKFVSAYRISCGRDADAIVIYHSGDSCNPRQLHPAGKIDIHIVHPRVSLSVPEAAKLLHPKEIWFSHLLEMGHCKPSIYRPVDWISAYVDMGQMKAEGMQISCRLPIWGEKIVIP